MQIFFFFMMRDWIFMSSFIGIKLSLIIRLVDDNLLKSTGRFVRDNDNVTSRRSYLTMTMIGDATDFSTYKQLLTGVEHSRWDIGHRGIVSYLSFGRVTPNSPGGPDELVSGPIRTRSRFDDRKLLALIKRSAWKRSERRRWNRPRVTARNYTLVRFGACSSVPKNVSHFISQEEISDTTRFIDSN